MLTPYPLPPLLPRQAPDHGETYASTASFLLRLLVDDRHVCLVAVAKPIPEPAAPLPAALDPTRNSALPASTPVDTTLQSLHLSTSPSSFDGDGSSSVSSSPRANSSVFSSTSTERPTPGVAPSHHKHAVSTHAIISDASTTPLPPLSSLTYSQSVGCLRSSPLTICRADGGGACEESPYCSTCPTDGWGGEDG